VGETIDAIAQHWQHLRSTIYYDAREHQRVGREFRSILQGMALDLVRERIPDEQFQDIMARIQRREIDPYTAAERMLGDALGVTDLKS
jgi:LAO/AO transport system kinase